MLWKLASIALLLVMGGCGDVIMPPSSPQEKAAEMLDDQIVIVQTEISSHASRLSTDRNRWTLEDVKIETQLYSRLDDLHRQRQLLAQELAKQEFIPNKAAPVDSRVGDSSRKIFGNLGFHSENQKTETI